MVFLRCGLFSYTVGISYLIPTDKAPLKTGLYLCLLTYAALWVFTQKQAPTGTARTAGAALFHSFGAISNRSVNRHKSHQHH